MRMRGRTGIRWVGVLVTAVMLASAFSCTRRSYHPSYPNAKVIHLADIEFDDGDTFFLKGEPIRVLGIDTPEIAHPKLGFDEPQPFGIEAAESTRVWMTRASLLEYVPDGRDRYNRRLAHVFVDGELLAIRLINHALAYETVSFYGDSGFPDLAQQILDASRVAPKPQFEEPYKWKQKHRRKKP